MESPRPISHNNIAAVPGNDRCHRSQTGWWSFVQRWCTSYIIFESSFSFASCLYCFRSRCLATICLFGYDNNGLYFSSLTRIGMFVLCMAHFDINQLVINNVMCPCSFAESRLGELGNDPTWRESWQKHWHECDSVSEWHSSQKHLCLWQLAVFSGITRGDFLIPLEARFPPSFEWTWPGYFGGKQKKQILLPVMLQTVSVSSTSREAP